MPRLVRGIHFAASSVPVGQAERPVTRWIPRTSRGMTVQWASRPELEPLAQFLGFTRTALSPAMSSGWAATTRPSFTSPNTGMLAVMASWSVAEKGFS